MYLFIHGHKKAEGFLVYLFGNLHTYSEGFLCNHSGIDTRKRRDLDVKKPGDNLPGYQWL